MESRASEGVGGSMTVRIECPDVGDDTLTVNHLLGWAVAQPDGLQLASADAVFSKLLERAGQHKSESGNACVLLCGFVGRCARPDSPSLRLREWALSDGAVAARLFDFYLERNETDEHRSMRLIPDLIASLLLPAAVPEHSAAATAAAHARLRVLDRLASIIAGAAATKPAAKSAIKLLDHMLCRTPPLFDGADVGRAYGRAKQNHSVGPAHPAAIRPDDAPLWSGLMADLLGWMRIHFVRAAAGHLTVTLYRILRRGLRIEHPDSDCPETKWFFFPDDWQLCLLRAVSADPSLLGPIQSYIYQPLFKNWRPDGLAYLDSLSVRRISADARLDVAALLRLTALKMAKKAGLVDEVVGPGGDADPEDKGGLMDAVALGQALRHSSAQIRSLALSLVVASASTTRPFPPRSLDLLRTHLPAYFADLDATFRHEVVAATKDMYRRLRASMFALEKNMAKEVRARAPPPVEGEGGEEQQQKEETSTGGLSLQSRQQHCRFLEWYLDFLKAELVPTASYQRHATALRALGHLLRMETDPEKAWAAAAPEDETIVFHRLDRSWARALLDLLMDPFEDVRSFCATVLDLVLSDGRFQMLAPSTESSRPVSVRMMLVEFSDRAAELATRTGRADHADGAGRAARLLFKHSGSPEWRLGYAEKMVADLVIKTGLAEKDLGRAVRLAPLHGGLASLCHIWQSLAEADYSEEEAGRLLVLSEPIMACCRRIWAAVRAVLCDASPEGHVPEDLEGADSGEALDTKELVSFSFRAVHESSNLMKAMVLVGKKKARLGPTLVVFRQIGDLSFEQLAAVRHAGALGTVSATFAVCCQMVEAIEGMDRRYGGGDRGEDGGDEGDGGDERGKVADGNVETAGTLLDRWHAGALTCIWSGWPTTRRSAGIPAIVIGILSAAAAKPSLESVMEDLMRIARIEPDRSSEDASRPQVHAHNCLREIFRTSVLGSSQAGKVDRYLSVCLELAAGSLGSDVWAIRNCGLLLLRSLVDCLFGTVENKAAIEAGWDGRTARIHYHKYPALPAVLVGLLRRGLDGGGGAAIGPGLENTRGAESVFPALDVIRRAGPPLEPEAGRELRGLVACYLASRVWHVREMAARTLCSCLLRDEGWLDAVGEILQAALAAGDPNHVHGAYLALRLVVEKMADVAAAQMTENVPRLKAILAHLTETWPAMFQRCQPVLAAHLEVVNTVTAHELGGGTTDGRDLQRPIRDRISTEAMVSDCATNPLLRAQLGRFIVYRAVRAGHVDDAAHAALADVINRVAAVDPPSAAGMVETLCAAAHGPDRGSCSERLRSAPLLWRVCAAVALHAEPDEPRVVAINSLVDVVGQTEAAPSNRERDQLMRLWEWLGRRRDKLGPRLANASLRLSGVLARWSLLIQPAYARSRGFVEWGLMVTEAGRAYQSFDTRLAAVTALGALGSHSALDLSSSAADAIPSRLALYDCLNDDDDEIREAAAALVVSGSSGRDSGSPLEPVAAAEYYLDHLAAKLAANQDFRAVVARRLAGEAPAPAKREPAAARLQRALAPAAGAAGALFAAEEPNLFVDEVREARRWARALAIVAARCGDAARSDASFASLREWSVAGLRELVRLCGERGDDGPLGWTSRPDVFAICGHVIVSAAALLRAGLGGDVGRLEAGLHDLREVGSATRLSGLLLDMMMMPGENGPK